MHFHNFIRILRELYQNFCQQNGSRGTVVVVDDVVTIDVVVGATVVVPIKDPFK